MTKASKNKKVIAVVVTYNRKELLKECINALLNQEYDNCDVLIVDNASTDGTKEYISKELKNKKVHYANTGTNLGGAGGFNYGMKEAYKIGCDYMWLMDDDCIVHNDSLVKLFEASKKLKNQYGFLSSKVLWKDNSICKMNIQKNNLFKKNTEWNKQVVNVIMSTFVSFFIPREIVKEEGLPITDFFIWSDDLEYSRRISRKYPCYLVNDSIVTHKSKNNIGSNIVEDDESKLNRYRCAYRNEYYLFRREGIIGKLYYFLKTNLHKFKIKKSSNSPKEKKTKIELINDAIKVGKKFYPKIEYVHDYPIRILQLFGEPLSNGGQEAALMNIYRNIDRSKFQFDFYTPFYNDNIQMRTEIENLGGKVFASNGKFESMFRKLYFARNTKKFLKNNKYDFIHINSGSLFQLAMGAKIAYKNGAKKIITHSHATGTNNFKYKLAKTLYSSYFKKYPTDLLACSNLAGKWKYPNDTYKIIKNGIDIDKFKFKPDNRKKYRNILNINNRKVLVNVGRMSDEKNQLFLLDIMSELKKIDNSYLLIIVGSGELKDKIELKIKSNNLEDSVLLLGIRNDISEILSASDVFVFPSLWEGLGIAAIEAQTSGLPVLCSKGVAEEAEILNSFEWYDLNNGADLWAKQIEKKFNELPEIADREKAAIVLKQNGYDAKYSVKELENIYLDK